MKRQETYALGIDLGGTQIRAALVREDGSLASPLVSAPTDARILERDLLYARIRETALKATANLPIVGIGIGSTGPVSSRSGEILDCDNLPSLQYFPLRDRLASDLHVPAWLDNDANAFVLGEALYGAGRNAESVFGLTLGTGLGSALVQKGRIMHGQSECAGEIWTAPYKDSILEDYLSGTALSRLFREKTGINVSGKEVATRARKEDAAALDVWDTFTQALAYTLSWCVNLLDPDVVVLGGSVVASAPLFLEKALEQFRKYICTPSRAHVRVKLSALGNEAGVKGAAALVWNAL